MFVHIKAALTLAAAFFIFTGPAQAGTAEDPERYFWARVVQVKDGDTLLAVRANVGLDLLTIRLYGLDAPEKDQPHGKAATRKLTQLAAKKIVQIEVIQKADRYGRIVGIVKQDGQDVGLAMAQAGLAWVEPRFCKRRAPCRKYWATVRQAIKNKTGLWDGRSVPPWTWRK